MFRNNCVGEGVKVICAELSGAKFNHLFVYGTSKQSAESYAKKLGNKIEYKKYHLL